MHCAWDSVWPCNGLSLSLFVVNYTLVATILSTYVQNHHKLALSKIHLPSFKNALKLSCWQSMICRACFVSRTIQNPRNINLPHTVPYSWDHCISKVSTSLWDDVCRLRVLYFIKKKLKKRLNDNPFLVSLQRIHSTRHRKIEHRLPYRYSRKNPVCWK